MILTPAELTLTIVSLENTVSEILVKLDTSPDDIYLSSDLRTATASLVAINRKLRALQDVTGR